MTGPDAPGHSEGSEYFCEWEFWMLNELPKPSRNMFSLGHYHYWVKTENFHLQQK